MIVLYLPLEIPSYFLVEISRSQCTGFFFPLFFLFNIKIHSSPACSRKKNYDKYIKGNASRRICPMHVNWHLGNYTYMIACTVDFHRET
jgi:hypothetical protein